MKKIIMICMALLLGLSMAGCANKQEGSVEKEEIKQEVASAPEASQEAKEDEKKTLEKYTKLIGLSREEIIDAMGEEPTVVDEGGWEFSKAKIRVWFIEDGKTVDQIFIDDSEVDFNGARIDGNIEDFKHVFGKPVLEDTGSAYSNFDYEGLVLHVQYNPSTEKVVGVYLLKEWK